MFNSIHQGRYYTNLLNKYKGNSNTLKLINNETKNNDIGYIGYRENKGLVGTIEPFSGMLGSNKVSKENEKIMERLKEKERIFQEKLREYVDAEKRLLEISNDYIKSNDGRKPMTKNIQVTSIQNVDNVKASWKGCYKDNIYGSFIEQTDLINSSVSECKNRAADYGSGAFFLQPNKDNEIKCWINKTNTRSPEVRELGTKIGISNSIVTGGKWGNQTAFGIRNDGTIGIGRMDNNDFINSSDFISVRDIKSQDGCDPIYGARINVISSTYGANCNGKENIYAWDKAMSTYKKEEIQEENKEKIEKLNKEIQGLTTDKNEILQTYSNQLNAIQEQENAINVQKQNIINDFQKKIDGIKNDQQTIINTINNQIQNLENQKNQEITAINNKIQQGMNKTKQSFQEQLKGLQSDKQALLNVFNQQIDNINNQKQKALSDFYQMEQSIQSEKQSGLPSVIIEAQENAIQKEKEKIIQDSNSKIEAINIQKANTVSGIQNKINELNTAQSEIETADTRGFTAEKQNITNNYNAKINELQKQIEETKQDIQNKINGLESDKNIILQTYTNKEEQLTKTKNNIIQERNNAIQQLNVKDNNLEQQLKQLQN